jgi:uncharacterized protein
MALLNKQQLKKFKGKATDIFNRVIDQHVTIAVTGLSGSGKTAFITSLVNQLLNEGVESQLTFFDPVHEQRFIAAKRVPQKHLHIPRFDYEQAMAAFAVEPPQWPAPTKGISELRLAIRYKPAQSLLKYATEMATITLDITDYPGEWLLDLSMLNQTYEQWSEQMTKLLQQTPRVEHAQAFIDRLASIDPWQAADENLLKSLAEQYTELLCYFHRELGLSVIQPGRFILPAELAGAPILQFFPYTALSELDGNQYQNAKDDTLIGMLRARFIEYKERVVKRFYQQHFSQFDRQIVLMDCLSPLNQGPDCFTDLQYAIDLILENFNYGASNWLSRLFAPKIDKLLFAATKADHVTPEQHKPLTALLNQLVYRQKQQLSFNNIAIKSLAIASVQATETGHTQYQGKKIPVLQGYELTQRKLTTLFPGTVPEQLPTPEYWQQQAFKFIHFAPKQGVKAHQVLPHVRMDQVLQFLLADKMT